MGRRKTIVFFFSFGERERKQTLQVKEIQTKEDDQASTLQLGCTEQKKACARKNMCIELVAFIGTWKRMTDSNSLVLPSAGCAKAKEKKRNPTFNTNQMLSQRKVKTLETPKAKRSLFIRRR